MTRYGSHRGHCGTILSESVAAAQTDSKHESNHSGAQSMVANIGRSTDALHSSEWPLQGLPPYDAWVVRD
eukprot:COSAG01_NODE_2533_length_7491_cov_236.560741_16_plen_69_part_01